jgi:hypothetical protein
MRTCANNFKRVRFLFYFRSVQQTSSLNTTCAGEPDFFALRPKTAVLPLPDYIKVIEDKAQLEEARQATGHPLHGFEKFLGAPENRTNHAHYKDWVSYVTGSIRKMDLEVAR